MLQFSFILPFSLLLTILLPTAFAQCPNGDYLQQSGFCYKYFNNSLPQLAAEQQCIQDNGHLVSIHSVDERDLVLRSSGGAIPMNVSTWTGLMANNGNYSWTDNSVYDYNYWYPGFPSVTMGTCVAAVPVEVDDSNLGQWMNRNCQESRPFVCKATNGAGTSGPNTCLMPNYYSNYGTIQSSGYPIQYGNNLNCDYHLSVPSSYPSITIKFGSDFATEACCDKVTIYDGDSRSSRVIGRISGKDGANRQFTSTTNRMLVSFQTDPSGTDKGWSATFRGTQPNGQSCMPTSPAIEGPYYLQNPPPINGTLCMGTSEAQQRFIVTGQVLDASDCSTPVPAKLDIWHSNMEGQYSHFMYLPDYDCRGTIETDAMGRFTFQTKFPGRYLIDPNDTTSYRPAHIHLKLTPKSSLYGGTLTTQFYFKTDVYLWPRDACGVEYCKSDQASLITPINNLRDVKTFEGQWNIYIKRGGNGNINDQRSVKGY